MTHKSCEQTQFQRLRDAFADPPRECQLGLVWLWNGPVTPEGITRDIQEMADKGCGGFVVRPTSVVQPAYLSDAYLTLLESAVEQAQDAGLYVWLALDAAWPGEGTGLLPPAYQAQLLEVERRSVRPGDRLAIPEDCVAAAAVLGHGEVRPGGTGCQPVLLAPTAGRVRAPEGATAVLFFCARDAGMEVDTASPDAVSALIAATLERYAQRLGPYFGAVITGILVTHTPPPDQLSTTQLPWSPRLPEAFEQRQGHDVRECLPHLLPGAVVGMLEGERADAERIAARCAFYATWTAVCREAYWQQLRHWCTAHGVVCAALAAGGEGAPVPRVDDLRLATAAEVLGVRVEAGPLAQQASWTDAVLLASSPAGPSPRPRPEGEGGRRPGEGRTRPPAALAEVSTGYASGLGFADLRCIMDGQLVRGAHLLLAAPYCHVKEDLPRHELISHLGPGNPLWLNLAEFTRYVGRLSVLGRAGEAAPSVAVYMPIEAAWAQLGGNAGERFSRPTRSLEGITALLASQHVAFDLIDHEMLAEAGLDDEVVVTAGAQYEMVIVPETPVLLVGSAMKLLAFRRAGGRIVFASAQPPMIVVHQTLEPLSEAFGELLAGAYELDLPKRIDVIGGAFGWPEADWMVSMLDGVASAYYAAGAWLTRFGGARLQPGVVLTVPEKGLGPFAQIMGEMYAPAPARVSSESEAVRSLVRYLDDGSSVVFVTNEAARPADVRVEVISAAPMVLERWDATTGTVRPVLLHQEPTEATSTTVTLDAGRSAVLAARLFREGEEPPRVVPKRPQRRQGEAEEAWPLLRVLGAPTVVRMFLLEKGKLVEADSDLPQFPPDAVADHLGIWQPWHGYGLAEFCGTVRYDFALSWPGAAESTPLTLSLGEVLHVARVVVNGRALPASLWPPHVSDITELVQPGENRIEVYVTNTLAAQVRRLWQTEGQLASDSAAAQLLGDRAVSGLIGPVTLTVDRPAGLLSS